MPERCEPVLGAGQDERGRPDRGEALPDVEPVAGEEVAERHERCYLAQDAGDQPDALLRGGRPEREVLDEALPFPRMLAQEVHDPGQHPEPRARADQDQPGEARRPREREGLGDGAAHRVPDEDGRQVPQRLEKGAEPLRVRGDARLAPAAERPVTRQIGRHDPRDAGEPLELRSPELRGSAGAVNQDEGRA